MPPRLPPKSLEALHAFAARGGRAVGPEAKRVRRSLAYLSQPHHLKRLPPAARAKLERMRASSTIQPSDALHFMEDLWQHGFLVDQTHHRQAAGFHKVAVLMAWCKTYYPRIGKALGKLEKWPKGKQPQRSELEYQKQAFEEAVRPAMSVGPEADLARLETGFARVLDLSPAEFRNAPEDQLLERLINKVADYLPASDRGLAKRFAFPGGAPSKALTDRERQVLDLSLKQARFRTSLVKSVDDLAHRIEAIQRKQNKRTRMKQLQDLYLETFFTPDLRSLYNQLFPVPARVPASPQGDRYGKILEKFGMGLDEFMYPPKAVAAAVGRLIAVDPQTARARLRQTQQAVWRILQGDQKARAMVTTQLWSNVFAFPEEKEIQVSEEIRLRLTEEGARRLRQLRQARQRRARTIEAMSMHADMLRDAFKPLANAMEHNLTLLDQALARALHRPLP